MIKRILVPTDFSGPSINATEYAAKLAKKLNARLTLMHVQQIYLNEGLNLLSGEELESVREARMADKQMEATCEEISDTFGVSCAHEVQSTVGGLVGKIAGEANLFDLTVIGSNGADTAFQFYFGSHSYRIASKSGMPTLIVPEACPYTEPRKLAFVSDFRKGEKLSVSQLRGFVEATGTRIIPVHAAGDQDHARDHFEAFSSSIAGNFEPDSILPAESAGGPDITEAVFSHVSDSGADAMALCRTGHGLIYEATHTDLVKKITSGSAFPVLLFQS